MIGTLHALPTAIYQAVKLKFVQIIEIIFKQLTFLIVRHGILHVLLILLELLVRQKHVIIMDHRLVQ